MALSSKPDTRAAALAEGKGQGKLRTSLVRSEHKADQVAGRVQGGERRATRATFATGLPDTLASRPVLWCYRFLPRLLSFVSSAASRSSPMNRISLLLSPLLSKGDHFLYHTPLSPTLSLSLPFTLFFSLFLTLVYFFQSIQAYLLLSYFYSFFSLFFLNFFPYLTKLISLLTHIFFPITFFPLISTFFSFFLPFSPYPSLFTSFFSLSPLSSS